MSHGSGLCGRGEIGRRARLRIWFRKEWGFKSLRPHHFLTRDAFAT